jgi:hypothetical protein
VIPASRTATQSRSTIVRLAGISLRSRQGSYTAERSRQGSYIGARNRKGG